MKRSKLVCLLTVAAINLALVYFFAVPERPVEKPVAEKKERFRGTVDLYMTDWCPQCKLAREYLDGRKISYRAMDVEKEPAAMAKYQQHGGRGVPLIVAGARVFHGFNAAALDSALGF